MVPVRSGWINASSLPCPRASRIRSIPTLLNSSLLSDDEKLFSKEAPSGAADEVNPHQQWMRGKYTFRRERQKPIDQFDDVKTSDLESFRA
jgi:hypothetical protein